MSEHVVNMTTTEWNAHIDGIRNRADQAILQRDTELATLKQENERLKAACNKNSEDEILQGNLEAQLTLQKQLSDNLAKALEGLQHAYGNREPLNYEDKMKLIHESSAALSAHRKANNATE